MSTEQRRSLVRAGATGLATLVVLYVAVLVIDRGRNLATFSLVYAVLVLWPGWRYVVAPLVEAARGRVVEATGPVSVSGDKRWVYVGDLRLRTASAGQFGGVADGRSFRVSYGPLTRVVLEAEDLG
jgi:hypothetical protein